MSGELPRDSNRFPNSATTRRRHNHNVDLSGQEEPSTKGAHSLVNFGQFGQSNGQLAAHTEGTSNLAPTYIPPKESRSNQPTPSSSFSNFSSLIAAPASQIWSSAQNSIQAFASAAADQYSQSLEYQPEYNFPERQDIDLPPPFHQVEMPFRDRTQEFRVVTKSCQLKYQANGNHQNKEDREKIIRSSVQFNQLARRIGRDLSLTCAKMEKLTQLAKKKSLFDDRAGEVEELSQIIKQDITGLNKQIANLQEVIKQRAVSNNSQEQQGQHSKLVVVGLQSKLASVGKDFQNVLEKCTENLKLKKNRRDKFSQPACVPSNLPPSASSGNMGSVLLHDDAIASSSSVAVDMDRLEQQRMQEQLSLIDGSETYHRDRYNAMENIESSISELGTIFGQLASLVAEQGEMITRIDSNVEETSINVDAAHHELLKYFNNISRNRWLIIKVFGVLAAFFIFFVIFMT